MKPSRELLCCRSGRKTKADRSERRYNQLWVLRKKPFARSFQSSFTSSHLHTTFYHHPPLSMWSLSAAVVPAQTNTIQGLNRQTGNRHFSGPTTQTRRWGSRQGSTSVQSSAEPEGSLLGVCVCVCRCYWEAWLSPERSTINCEVKEPEGDTRDLH